MIAALILTAVSATFGAACTGEAGPDSALDKARGWVTLATPESFRGYKQTGFPSKGWTMRDGVLHHAAGGGGGDIVTTEEYGDFELELEFKVAPKANSGIMYRVTEQHGAPWMTGPEFQVLDDAGHNLKPDHPHACGAMYDLAPAPAPKATRPAGEWNTARIRLYDGAVQHFLNGVKVVDQRLDDAGWTEKIAASKFAAYSGFGTQPRGRIALQDHGDEVWYRHIRVRRLDAAWPGEKALFNGNDMTGWTHHLADPTPMEKVWSVRDGVIVCGGNPAGYIRTVDDHTNFVLRLDWRWNPQTKKAGNSGVLVRMIGEDKVWPTSVEAQLMSGRAGDFWNIGDYAMTTDPERTKGRNTRHTHAAERPVGEWNQYEIVVHKGDVILLVNGEEVNRATGVTENAGKICLQSEGAEIHFRRILLTPVEVSPK